MFSKNKFEKLKRNYTYSKNKFEKLKKTLHVFQK